MLTEQDINEYKNTVKKISGIEITFAEAKIQAEKIFQMYLAVYSKNLLGSEE